MTCISTVANREIMPAASIDEMLLLGYKRAVAAYCPLPADRRVEKLDFVTGVAPNEAPIHANFRHEKLRVRLTLGIRPMLSGILSPLCDDGRGELRL
jgi:hypothetical protein